MRPIKNIAAVLAMISEFSAIGGVWLALPRVTPRMYFADDVSGRPFSKDPAVVKFNSKYWLYYSVPPYEGKPTTGWNIGVATSNNLVDWVKAANCATLARLSRRRLDSAGGAIVLDGKVHLF